MNRQLKVLYVQSAQAAPEIRTIEFDIDAFERLLHGPPMASPLDRLAIVWYADEDFDKKPRPMNRIIRGCPVYGPLFVAGIDDHGNTTDLSADQMDRVATLLEQFA